MNTVVNSNTLFIGLPLNIALFGDKSLSYFLIYYVTNTISTWTFGAMLINNDVYNNETQGILFNWKKLFPPPLLGFIVALIFLVFNIHIPIFISSALGYLGGMVTPLFLRNIEYATNFVTLSTLLFTIVIPVITTLLAGI